MKTHVEFRSDKFPPYEGEEEEINPDLLGKRLAEYLEQKLNAEGIETGEMNPEDWAWVLPIKNDSFSLWIGCGHYQEYSDGYLCFVIPSKPVIRRFFKKIDTTQKVSRITDALDNIFTSDPDIRNVRWWDESEVNL